MKIGRIILGTSLMLICATSLAGMKQSVNVTITPDGNGGGYAAGTMASARFARDKTSLIGCGFHSASGMTYGYCQAQDTDGNFAFCYTFDAPLLDAIRTLNSYSALGFGWSSDGTCSSIDTSTQSQYLPARNDDHEAYGHHHR